MMYNNVNYDFDFMVQTNLTKCYVFKVAKYRFKPIIKRLIIDLEKIVIDQEI